MRPPPDVFQLRQQERLLGLVHVTGLWDMFWFSVRFEPTEAAVEREVVPQEGIPVELDPIRDRGAGIRREGQPVVRRADLGIVPVTLPENVEDVLNSLERRFTKDVFLPRTVEIVGNGSV